MAVRIFGKTDLESDADSSTQPYDPDIPYLFCNKESRIESDTKLTNKSIICTKIFVLLNNTGKNKLLSTKEMIKVDYGTQN